MSKTTLRTLIIILTLATAAIHFYLNLVMGRFDVVFTLNGLGYLGLLGAFLLPIPGLKGREKLVWTAFMAYTAVTILAWVAMGEKNIATTQGILGYIDKAVELLLLGALWMHGKTTKFSFPNFKFINHKS